MPVRRLLPVLAALIAGLPAIAAACGALYRYETEIVTADAPDCLIFAGRAGITGGDTAELEVANTCDIPAAITCPADALCGIDAQRLGNRMQVAPGMSAVMTVPFRETPRLEWALDNDSGSVEYGFVYQDFDPCPVDEGALCAAAPDHSAPGPAAALALLALAIFRRRTRA